MWFHNGPSLCAGGGAPNFAFGPAASALRTAPYQRLELPPDAEASEASEAASEAARTVVILAFRDAGDEKRGGWPPDSIQHRDETSRGVGWNVGESCGNRERNGDIWPVFFSAINQLSMIYYSWISWENHLGNQYQKQPTVARDGILGPGRWWNMIDSEVDHRPLEVAAGKRLHNYGKSPFLMGK